MNEPSKPKCGGEHSAYWCLQVNLPVSCQNQTKTKPTEVCAVWAGVGLDGGGAPTLARLTVLSLQVPVASWFDNMSDTELHDLLPFFEQLSRVDDVYSVLRQPRLGS